MSAKGSFSFRNDKILQTPINDGVVLRLDRVGLAVARVFFIDSGFVEVQIPDGFRVIDNTNGDILVQPLPGRQEYFLGWADNYSLFLDGALVVKLINQRQWAIQAPLERAVMTVEN